ncbi:MAG TPA: hypothetical protein VFF09_00700 [archaeon]|nr:hypothetical protein [archaeon]
MQDTVTISKSRYTKLKQQANIDMEFLKELASSLADIKAGRVRRVR